MIRAEDLESAIQRGIEFLKKSQLPSGEFKTLVASDPDIRLNAKHDPSIFTTVNVATSLLEVEESHARTIVARAADFLISEMLPGGLWRFWTKAHPGSPGMPPDVDDTACVSALLKVLGRLIPDNRKILMANRCRDGRFLTWITPRARHLVFVEGRAFLSASLATRRARKLYFESGPQPPERENIDCVVNANALFYLGDSKDMIQSASWVADVFLNHKAASNDRWYQSDIALLYSVARCYENRLKTFCQIKPLLVKKAEELQPSCNSALAAGLMVSILNVFAPTSPKLFRFIHTILAMQEEDGGWPARVYYYDSYKRALCWGSKELTTGFCVEALARFSKFQKKL